MRVMFYFISVRVVSVGKGCGSVLWPRSALLLERRWRRVPPVYIRWLRRQRQQIHHGWWMLQQVRRRPPTSPYLLANWLLPASSWGPLRRSGGSLVLRLDAWRLLGILLYRLWLQWQQFPWLRRLFCLLQFRYAAFENVTTQRNISLPKHKAVIQSANLDYLTSWANH